jgi:uncharacterized protein (TIGR02284 family)
MNNIETIEKLLKAELSATETYQQAMEKFKEDVELSGAEHLTPIYEDHKEAVSSLQEQMQQLGGTPPEGSGAWGVWAEIVQGAANLMGKESALKALRTGEKKGTDDYEEALQDPELSSEVRSLIEKLLPAQQSHVVTLDRLIDTMAD